MPDIKVIDSIMGSGKTTWAINYMNAHQDEHFIYITPFLNECERVKQACPELDFIEPEEAYGKQASFKRLISQGANIVTTHKLLSVIKLSETDKEFLKGYSYSFIIDEAVETIMPVESTSKKDARILLDSGWIEIEDDGRVNWIESDDEDGETKKFADIKDMANAGTLVWFRDSLFMWLLPIDTISAIPHLYVLTFLFDSSHLKHYLDVYDVGYDIYHINDGQLCEGEQDLTATKQKLSELITIYEGRLNDVGDSYGSLSATRWKSKTATNMAMKHIVINNARNYFMNISKKTGRECIWSSYKNENFTVKNYVQSFVPFNSRATNAYGDRDCLAYLVDVFENPNVRGWFEDRGVKIDERKTALSTMLQWIWRSAIRNDKPISIYLPSKRMRDILKEFLTPNVMES